MNYRRWILLIFTGVLPLAFWPGSTSYEMAKLTVLALAVGFWLMNFGYRCLKRGSVQVPASSFFLALGGWLAVVLLGLFTSANHSLFLIETLLGLLWFSVLFFTLMSVDSPESRHQVLAVMVLAGTIAGLYGIAQMAGWVPGAPLDSGYPPGISTFGNQNYLAGFAAFLICPSCVLWWPLRSNSWRGWPFAKNFTKTLVLGLTVGLANTTGAQIALLGTGLVLLPALLLVRSGRPTRVPGVLGLMVGLGLLAALAGITFLMSDNPAQQDSWYGKITGARLLTENNVSIRQADWIIGKQMIADSPWVGTGLGGYSFGWIGTRASLAGKPIDEKIPSYLPAANWAHNDFLQWVAETGLAGGVYLLVVLVCGARLWSKRWLTLASDEHRVEYLLLSGGLATVFIHGLVSFPMHLPATVCGVTVLVGLLASNSWGKLGQELRRGQIGPWPGRLVFLIGLTVAVGGLREFTGDLSAARGRRLYTAGQGEKAVQMLSRSINNSYWPNQAHLYRGLAQLSLDRTTQAMADLQKSLDLDPSFEGLLALAELKIQAGAFPQAEGLIQTVLQCRPYLPLQLQARFLQGLNQVRQGNHDLARQIFVNLLAEDPQNQRTCLGLGYLEALEGNNDQARRYYGQALTCIDLKLKSQDPQTSGALIQMLRSHRLAAAKALESVAAH